MVGTGNIVAQGLGAPGPHEDGASIPDPAQKRERVLAVKLEVLRGNHVDRIDGIAQGGAADHQAPLRKRGARDPLARGLGDQEPHGVENALGQVGIAGHQVAGGHGVVLGLGHEVRRDDCGVCAGIREDAHLGGSGDHVDAHVTRHASLGCRDVGVAGAHDLLDGRDGLRAIGDRSDCLGTPDGVDLIDAGDCGSGEGVGGKRAVALGWRDHDHALDAGDLRGD